MASGGDHLAAPDRAAPPATRRAPSIRAEFAQSYALPTSDTNARIEHDVIGAVWGVNGYTTVAQADELGRRLRLRPGMRLLDVGTGRGWPGLYLAKRHDCSVVGTDVPVEALVRAAARAGDEAIRDRVALAAATGAAQPFRPASFDAVVLTDVLC